MCIRDSTDGAKTNTSTTDKNVINDGAGNTNTATATSNNLADNAGNSNVSNATSNTLKNAAGDETKADAKGVTVKDAAGNNATFTKDGITITKTGKDTVSLTSDGLDNGKNKIVNVAAGVANTDAVNVGQDVYKRQGTVTVTGGTTNDITGLSNTTVTATDFATKGRAATEEQLKAVGEQTWQITADKDAITSGAQTGTKKDAKVGKDDKVQLIAGENMTVNQNERDFTFTLNKDLVKMNSATFEATGGKTTVIKGDSIVQTDGTKVNTSTAGGNTVVDGTKSTATIAAVSYTHLQVM